MRINILYSFYKPLYDWATTACYALRKLGIESDVYCSNSNISDNKDMYPNADYYIIINPSLIFLSKIPLDSKKIVWFTEQVDFSSKDQNVKCKSEEVKIYCPHFDLHIGFNKVFSQECENNGCKMDATFGYGYDEILTKYADTVEKDINIYFEGVNINDRRINILKTFSTPVTQLGHHMDEYKRNMASAKIALNLHAYDSNKCFEFPRIMSAICEKALVISEELIDCFPFINGKHIISLPADSLSDACEYYLNNPDQIVEISNAALDFVATQYRMDNMFIDFIKLHIDSDFMPQYVVPEFPNVEVLT